MISVLPCLDKEKIKELFINHNLTVCESSSAVIATQNDEQLGYCLYTLTKTAMCIYALEPQKDIPLADGILRSALHVSAENFVLDAFYDDCAPVALFELLGFIKNAEEKRLNVDKLFGGCNCHNKN